MQLTSIQSLLDRLQSLGDHPRIGPYWRLTRMDKPIGSLLILWPTLAMLWAAGEGRPDIHLIIIFTLGTFLMRSAGCAINDFADRDIDGQIDRTQQRPLATGELTARQALICFLTLCLISFILVLLTNRLTVLLSFIGALLAAVYPFLKRVTHLPQVWLGLAMNWGAVMAYAAQAGSLHPGVWVFYAATVLWTVAYDCFYAMVDREDDLKAGVKSIAILFGEQDRLLTAMLQATALFGFYLAGQRFEFGSLYQISILVGVGCTFVYQQWQVAHRTREAYFIAFLNNRWASLLLFIGVAADYFFKSFI